MESIIMNVTKQQHEDLIKGAVQTGSKSLGFAEASMMPEPLSLIIYLLRS